MTSTPPPPLLIRELPPPPAPGLSGRLTGIRAVAGLEIRQRLRSGRWQILLGIWFLLLLGLTALVRANVDVVDEFGGAERDRGPAMFGVLMLVVLGLSLLIVPSLTSASVNGDRDRGVLATLQVTRLSALEIGLGKFVAAWGAALVFLALTLPLVGWCMAEGGTPVGRVLVVLVVVALLLGVAAALGLALSALLARTTTSAVLAYLTVFALTSGTLLAFGLAAAATRETVTRTYSVPQIDPTTGATTYVEDSYETQEIRPDRVWWVLAPNPFVVLADAAPVAPRAQAPPGLDVADDPLDPLGSISAAVRDLRRPPDYDDGPAYSLGESDEGDRGPLVWPAGLAIDLVLGGLALLVVVRRLRTPSRRLPRGQRVA